MDHIPLYLALLWTIGAGAGLGLLISKIAQLIKSKKEE